MGLSDGSDGKESTCNAGDSGSIPGSERSPGEGHGNPFQYSCLENPTDRGTWQATVHGVVQSDTTEQLTLSLVLHAYVHMFTQCYKELGHGLWMLVSPESIGWTDRLDTHENQCFSSSPKAVC